jgi:hypothetical protein
VWVGITEDADDVWKSLSDIEDRISLEHPSLTFRFRVIPLSEHRRLNDYVSGGHQVFERAA